PAAAEAAMKYVIQGAVATGLYLAGLAIHVGVTGGGSDLGRVAAGMPEFALASTAATVFLLAAFAFKLGAVPFHSWAPDALETAPPSGSAFMASAPKIAAVLGLIILFSLTVEQVAIKTLPTLNHVILFATLAVGSILLGNLAGLPQTSYQRMLAYSGIAQVGYVLIGLATGSGAIPATMFLVSVYGLAALGAFLAAQFVHAARLGWDGSIAGMAGLGREHPVVAIALAILLLSLTGIPLTAGFWGKLYVFNFAVRAGLEWLVLLGVLGSVVSFGYYGAVLRSIFFDAPPAKRGTESDTEDVTLDRAAAGVVLVCASVVLALGIMPLFLGLFDPLTYFGYK
ncbi:MAG: proton-conducting transporter membrane subunit, partial [Coriobacteriia bacterium]|nr:proton-conducting transporter membrane subunit [Coriobacteriia bacterium]